MKLCSALRAAHKGRPLFLSTELAALNGRPAVAGGVRDVHAVNARGGKIGGGPTGMPRLRLATMGD